MKSITRFTQSGANSMHGAVVPIAYGSFSTNSAVFTSIPQGYQDLMLVVNARGTAATTQEFAGLRFNSDTGSNYSDTVLYGNGSSASSGSYTSVSYMNMVQYPSGNDTAGVYGSQIFHILNYANSSTYKTVLARAASDTNGSGLTILSAGLWRNTNAITTLSWVSASATPTNISTFALYGIRTVGQ